jgi:hypothetical protein
LPDEDGYRTDNETFHRTQILGLYIETTLIKAENK